MAAGSTHVAPPILATLSHAVVQYAADELGIDVLHIKGAALDPSMMADPVTGRVTPRMSTDADVLVRPRDIDRLVTRLTELGWECITSFDDGSAFHHASSMWHTHLGYVDVHRRFPGIGLDPTVAFDLLWRNHYRREVAHQAICVPSLDAQRLILLLHAARGGKDADRVRVWDEADDDTRDRICTLVDQLDAGVAFKVATGHADEVRDDPEADLWELYSTGNSTDRWAEWRARWRAERDLAGRLRVAWEILHVNRGHLRMELGHEPSRAEVRWAARRRLKRAVASIWRRR